MQPNLEYEPIIIALSPFLYRQPRSHLFLGSGDGNGGHGRLMVLLDRKLEKAKTGS